MQIDEIESVIETAIENCEAGVATPGERTIAAAAMIRIAYAYAEMEPARFADWLARVAADFRSFETTGNLH